MSPLIVIDDIMPSMVMLLITMLLQLGLLISHFTCVVEATVTRYGSMARESVERVLFALRSPDIDLLIYWFLLLFLQTQLTLFLTGFPTFVLQ